MEHRSFLIDLKKEDRVIRGDIRVQSTEGLHPILILCHGFKGFKDWGLFPYAAETLAKAGFAVISFNFSMNGVGEDPSTFGELEKFAQNTFSHEQEDLAHVMKGILLGKLPFSANMNTNQIGIIGHSRGGASSLLFALDEPRIQAVALWNSVAHPDFLSPAFKQELREKGRAYIPNARTKQQMPINATLLEDLDANPEHYDILTRLTQYDRPLLIIHGENDTSVPIDAAHHLNEASSHSTLHAIPGADHTFGAVHPFQGETFYLREALESTIDFFRKIFS
ncbi:Dienelactone hydrolase family protein [Marininema mesophilum]|uniref:Dienelactone hydrolase family protein n=1 Tax=Marininema mesophilum TaxID=1048340 RepID=A0A1H2YZV7_9BACL|nr:alpha/beta fold hydrolase [Marininema mesophilum]SDX10621.1 Dienelactone hydrolase family protein [Marininema mesophilum]